MKIAVIPARGGSKRIPYKNIKDFCGKPMIAWSIEVAQASGLFEHIIVSTDDASISEIAKQWGAEVPFKRPDELSNDHAGTIEVIAHATQWALDQGWSVTAVCCIYATAPFIRKEDLKRGLEILESGNWQYVFSATTFASPIFRSFQMNAEGGLKMPFPEYFDVRSQDVPEILHDAGQFYWGLPQAWIDNVRIFDKSSSIVKVPRWRVQDMDTEEDWTHAELMAKYLCAET